jgi:DNA-binding MarR family transcriptional regulator
MKKKREVNEGDSAMFKIGKVFLTWRRYLQKQLVPHGITLKQLYLLRYLKREEFLYPAQIAEMLFCDRPTATVVVRNIERQGWVRRTPDPDNGKRVRVSITAAGRRKMSSLVDWRSGASFDPLKGLEKSEKKMLGKLLAKVDRSLQQIGD